MMKNETGICLYMKRIRRGVKAKSEGKSEAWVWVEAKSGGWRVRVLGFTFWLFGYGLSCTINLPVPQFLLQWKTILPSNSWVFTED